MPKVSNGVDNQHQKCSRFNTGPGSVQDDGGSEGGRIDNVLSDREMDENANEYVKENFEVQTERKEGIDEVETEVDEMPMRMRIKVLSLMVMKL